MLQLHSSDQQFHCLRRCGLYKRFAGKPLIYLLYSGFKSNQRGYRYIYMYTYIYMTSLSKQSYLNMGPCFNIKLSSHQCRSYLCRDKTLLPPSCHRKTYYTGKTTLTYWIIISSKVWKHNRKRSWTEIYYLIWFSLLVLPWIYAWRNNWWLTWNIVIWHNLAWYIMMGVVDISNKAFLLGLHLSCTTRIKYV